MIGIAQDGKAVIASQSRRDVCQANAGPVMPSDCLDSSVVHRQAGRKRLPRVANIDSQSAKAGGLHRRRQFRRQVAAFEFGWAKAVERSAAPPERGGAEMRPRPDRR